MKQRLTSLCCLLFTIPAFAQKAPERFKPRVVVVAYFERGADTGDAPGELQFWVERDHLDRVIDVPGMTHVVHANADGSEIAITIGEAQIRSTANLMAFATDPRFDLRETYWLITGIAGTSPLDGTLGDAFWTNFVINGDHRHSIDEREIPSTWPDGVFALQTTAPGQYPEGYSGSSEDVATWKLKGEARINKRGDVIHLNAPLLHWANDLTRNTKLTKDAAERANSAYYNGYPAAQADSRVRIGANIATEDFWYGRKKDEWAHRWIDFSTHHTAKFGTTAMNDTGALLALWSLTQSHRADWNRTLLLRTVSNFDRPPDGVDVIKAFNDQDKNGFSGFVPALESAYATGEPIVKALLGGAKPPTQ